MDCKHMFLEGASKPPSWRGPPTLRLLDYATNGGGRGGGSMLLQIAPMIAIVTCEKVGFFSFCDSDGGLDGVPGCGGCPFGRLAWSRQRGSQSRGNCMHWRPHGVAITCAPSSCAGGAESIARCESWLTFAGDANATRPPVLGACPGLGCRSTMVRATYLVSVPTAFADSLVVRPLRQHAAAHSQQRRMVLLLQERMLQAVCTAGRILGVWLRGQA